MIIWLLTRPAVVNWLIRIAKRRPYDIIPAPDGKLYMLRYWLFNPYPAAWWCPFSIRLNNILLPDPQDHEHDHPWNARTIILRGGYMETRGPVDWHCRLTGYTGRLLFGQYHKIIDVMPNTWTMFITWRYRGTWGYKVNGVKVPHREYNKGL